MLSLTLSIIISILFPCSVGIIIILCILKKTKLDILLLLALSYGLGLGVLTLWMFLLGVLRVPYSAPIISFSLLVFLLPLAYVTLKKNKAIPLEIQKINDEPFPSESGNKEKQSPWLIILFALLALYIGDSLSIAFIPSLLVPIHSWDALATIAFKAKVFFFGHGLPPIESFRNLPHSPYPIFVPLAETWIVLNLGFWSDQLIKVIFL